eukprot:6518474-Pyramimonas_sp.AAC.1
MLAVSVPVSRASLLGRTAMRETVTVERVSAASASGLRLASWTVSFGLSSRTSGESRCDRFVMLEVWAKPVPPPLPPLTW